MAALLLFGVAGTACIRTKRDIQRDYARKLQAAQLGPASAPSTQIRDLQVRIYVDDDYRTEMIRWRTRIEAQIERANRVLEAQFGVRLAVKEIEPWSRSGRTRTLSDALAELVEAAPGADGEWVIGFVSSSELFSGTLEQLGLAQMFGRHLVLRGMVSFREGDEFRRTLDALTDAERDELLHERELHRETAVLLHEWGHTLGAFHERDGDTIMSPLYGRSESAFSGVAARVVQLGLAQRVSTAPAARADWARDYRAEVERSRSAAWDAATVEQALAAANCLEAGAPPPGTRATADRARATRAAGARPAVGTPAEDAFAAGRGDAAALAQAEMNERLGDPVRAWKLVEPIAARLPERRQLQQYACHLRRRAEPHARATSACRTARALTARAAAILFARVLIESGDRAGGIAALMRAETAFASAPLPPAPREWADLADLLADVDACTVAERTAAHAGATRARGVVSKCAKTRQRVALPERDPGVEPSREPEYIDAVLRARGHAEAGRLAAARTAAAALESAFPNAPGGPFVRCLVEAQGGDPAAARGACSAADRGPPWAYEPPYVLGVLAGWDGRWTDARDQLRRALEREERDPGVWVRLAAAHEKLGATAEIEKLGARYRARFGKPLRPSW